MELSPLVLLLYMLSAVSTKVIGLAHLDYQRCYHCSASTSVKTTARILPLGTLS